MKTLKVIKFNSLVISFFLVVSLFVIEEAFAVTTYYVDKYNVHGGSCSDSAAGTSWATAWCTIQKAANSVGAGSTVIVANGTYTDTNSDNNIVVVNVSGISGSWITFKAENKWGAVLDGQNNTTSECWNLGTGRNYISIEDFEVRGCSLVGIGSNGGGNNIRIYRNKIHDIGRMCSDSAYGKVGIYIGTGTSYHTVDSNLIYSNGRKHCDTGECTGYPCDYDQNADHGIYLNGTSHDVIQNNILYDHTSGWAIHAFGGTQSYIDVLNNTFADSNPYRQGHILLSSNGGSNINIRDNISYNPNSFFLSSSKGYTNIIVDKNLVYGANLTGTTYTCSNYYTCLDNITGQNPQFVNIANKDFHLLSNSPAIDKGLAFPGRTKDADGNPIVGAPDIGAYEYGSQNADTTPPAPPRVIGAQ